MHFFSLACRSPATKVFFSRFRLRTKLGVRRYITKNVLIPAEFRDACSELSTSLSWLCCQGVAFRLGEPSTCMEKNTTVCYFSTARSALSVFIRSALPPAERHQSNCFYTLRWLLRRSYTRSAAAAAHMSNLIRICCTFPCDFCCTPRTE